MRIHVCKTLQMFHETLVHETFHETFNVLIKRFMDLHPYD